MDSDELIKQTKRMIKDAEKSSAIKIFSEAKEFLRIYAGEKSSFFKNLEESNQRMNQNIIKNRVISNLEGFLSYVENGLLDGVSLERRAQIDVVSDFLDQANTLLNSKKVHPAAPTVLIGAALEEFLRNWLEEANLNLNGKKPSLSSYAEVLRTNDLITKQDLKDITAWGGLRNYAAHGEWEEVSDKSRINIMLEGVNLFMRKYS